MKSMYIISLTLLAALFLVSPESQPKGSTNVSAVFASNEIFEPYTIHHTELPDMRPRAGQHWISVRVYSPNKKYYAYVEKTYDKTLKFKEFNSPRFGSRTIVGNSSDGSTKVVFEAKPKPDFYANPQLGIEDWTPDSSRLIFIEAYREGGMAYHVYDVEKQKLCKFSDDKNRIDHWMDMASMGWSNGTFILREIGTPQPDFFQWDPVTSTLTQLKEPPKGEFKRFGLVRKGDKGKVEDR